MVVWFCRIIYSLLHSMYHTVLYWLFCVPVLIHWSRSGWWSWSFEFVILFLVGFFDIIDHVEALLILVTVITMDAAVVGIGYFLPLIGTSLGVFSLTYLLKYLIFPGFSFGWPPWTLQFFCGLIFYDFGEIWWILGFGLFVIFLLQNFWLEIVSCPIVYDSH